MPLRITTRQLQIFESVARHRSFTRAALELHLTQPGVSMQMRKLQSLIGLPLYELPGRKVRLTKAGQTLFRHSRAFKSRLGKLERDLDDLREAAGEKRRKTAR